MSDDNTATTGNSDNTSEIETKNETPKTTESNETPKQSPSQKTSDKVTSENLWEDKVSRLHADLSRERDTVKSLRKERDELAEKVSSFTLKEKKTDLLNKALSEIGEDFEVPGDKLGTLTKLVGKISDSETLADDIAEAVSAIKSPRQKETRQINTLFAGSASAGKQSPATMTETQKLQLSREDPKRFQELFGSKIFR